MKEIEFGCRIVRDGVHDSIMNRRGKNFNGEPIALTLFERKSDPNNAVGGDCGKSRFHIG